MEAASPEFFKGSIELFRSMDPSLQPLWGIMTPQHMVEHLVGSWRISNGNARVQAVLSEDEVERRRAFLFSDQAYPQNLENPVFGGKPQALRKPDLQSAIDQLESEMNTFFEYHEAHPDASEVHPVFGALDYEGWMIFQTKHMGHHMRQFGLIQ